MIGVPIIKNGSELPTSLKPISKRNQLYGLTISCTNYKYQFQKLVIFIIPSMLDIGLWSRRKQFVNGLTLIFFILT